jgi:hypothetical protein
VTVRFDGQAPTVRVLGAGEPAPVSNDAPFRLGHDYWDSYHGRLQYWGKWDRVLSDAECVALYNSGQGLKYAELSAGVKTSLVSYWDLDEAGPGTRLDKHGTNHLSDVAGNVGTATGLRAGPGSPSP